METDKVSLDIAAPDTGKLQILFGEGAEVEIGVVIAEISGAASANHALPPTEVSQAGPLFGRSTSTHDGELRELHVPALGESIRDVVVAKWLKAEGDAVAWEEPVALLESEKVSVEVGAPIAGALTRQFVPEGAIIEVGALLATFAGAISSTRVPAPEDRAAATTAVPPSTPAMAGAPPNSGGAAPSTRPERRVRMTRLRSTIAHRLKDAQATAVMQTAMSDVDLGVLADLRRRHKEAFERRHGIRLGFLSFFAKAAAVALKEFPTVNAKVDDDHLIYRDYADIGIAVGTEQGLVVPVVRAVDSLSLAEIERAVAALAVRARGGGLALADMQGGTFTITNGGVYGSLISTPILNSPQSGILGMHAIQDRPVVLDGQIAIRPMMYLALSYDSRIVEDREAVTFLARIKQQLEDPERMLLGL